MSRRTLVVAALLGLAVGCGRGDRDVASRGGAVELEDLRIGEPIRHANLTIFPVVSKTPRNENPFITLDEGLKAGTVEIREIGSGVGADQDAQSGGVSSGSDDPFGTPSASNQPASQSTEPVSSNAHLDQESPTAPPTSDDDPFAAPSSNPQQQSAQTESGEEEDLLAGGTSDVNRLLVLNRSNKPLYLMPGEIIVGGQQDRVIGSELVIQPSDKPQPIEVFCVEQGRWHHRIAADLAGLITTRTWSEGDETSDVNPVADLAVTIAPEAENPEEASKVAAQGKFIATVGNVNKASRLAVQESGDQSIVWENVAKQNAVSGVASATQTGAFTKNYSDDDTLKRLEPLIEKMKDPVADTKNVVGVIVAVNGKVDSMDVFQSTPLFRQLWPKLLKSYALDAVNAQSEVEGDGETTPAECTKADAEQFLTKAFKSDEEGTETKNNVAVTTRRGQDYVSFSAGVAGEPGIGLGGGGFGGVHTSAFSK